MKRILKLITVMAVVFILCGCTKNNNSNPKETNLDEGFPIYKLSYMGVDIAPGSIFDENKINKKPVNVFSKAGCALYGLDYYYTYDDIEIVANLLEDEETMSVYSVSFLNGNVSTHEGIKIGSSVEDLVNAYGDNYDEFNGVYTYTGRDSYITIITEKDVVTGIEYTLVTN